MENFSVRERVLRVRPLYFVDLFTVNIRYLISFIFALKPKSFEDRHFNPIPMKQLNALIKGGYSFTLILPTIWLLLGSHSAAAQSCPANALTNINSFPNTYYPASQANVAAGSTSVILGAVTNGTTPISSGDIVLIIQMQGAQINNTNSSRYGDGAGIGGGYLNNANLLAGAMEYAVASNNVPLTGGTLNLVSALGNSYQNTAYGTDGQYTYQVIRVPIYYDVALGGTITTPRWDGSTGGVIVLFATDNINLNSHTIYASGLGFRGGGGRSLSGSNSSSNTDFRTSASTKANGSKGEGIAGTPKYVLNSTNSTITNTAVEGYPNGSYAMGAPANAGGGGTDGDPSSNTQNTGGGGGANGGAGGVGGDAWSSAIASGGGPGSIFAQASASRLVMGGGGGAGTTNDGTGTPGGGIASSGSAGGGIIILYSQNTISGTGTISADGAAGNATVQNDGAGGAGAGGSIVVFSKNGGANNITVTAIGGVGGTNQAGGGVSHGPGGGGGGGVIYSNIALNAASTVSGGAAGWTNGGTTHYGAVAGSTGVLVQTMAATAPAQIPLHCVALATSFLDVAAVQGNDVINVKWSVSNEVRTLEYIVERSSDGVNFSAIGSAAYLPGATGRYAYSDNDVPAAAAVLFYRIREVEAGGDVVYSKVVSVHLSGLSVGLSAYPNPAGSTVTVSFTSIVAGAISLRLFDLKGSMLWQQQYQAVAGGNAVTLDCVRAVPDGLYILQWFDGLNPRQVKVMVRH